MSLVEVQTWIELIKNKYHLFFQGLIFSILITLIFFATIDNLLTSLNNYRFIIYGCIIIFEIVYWIIFRWRLPRNKKIKVGVVIAIYCDNEKEKSKLKADFISQIHKNSQEENLLSTFHFVFLKNHFSKQILDSENPVECIREMNKKIKAHYFVWGEVKKRKDGEEKYFFELDGYVVHKPVPEEVSQKISKDFSTLLPKKIEFFEKLQLKGFQISAEFVYLSIKYIVGVAAFVSTDIFLAEKLHKNLYLRFNEFKPLPSHLQEIRTNAYTLFIEETYLIALYYHSYGGESKIQKVKECLDLVFKHSPKHYGALLIKSQLDFFDGDIQGSIKTVLAASNNSNGNLTWRYNIVFLWFWEEQFEKALKVCKQIHSQQYEGEERTIQQVIDFCLKILEKKPEKTQLYFWMGYLAYFKQNDLANAHDFFTKFHKTTSGFKELKTLSEAYIVKIEKTMQIK